MSACRASAVAVVVKADAATMREGERHEMVVAVTEVVRKNPMAASLAMEMGGANSMFACRARATVRMAGPSDQIALGCTESPSADGTNANSHDPPRNSGNRKTRVVLRPGKLPRERRRCCRENRRAVQMTKGVVTS